MTACGSCHSLRRRVCLRLSRRTGSATAAQHTVSCASCSVYEKKVRYLAEHQPISQLRGLHELHRQTSPGSHLKKKPKPTAPGKCLASGDRKCQVHTKECQARRAKCTVDATCRRICAYLEAGQHTGNVSYAGQAARRVLSSSLVQPRYRVERTPGGVCGGLLSVYLSISC